MSMPVSRSVSRTLAILLLLSVLAGLHFGVALPLLDEYETGVAEIEELEFRIARYREVLRSKPALEARLAKVSGDNSVAKHLLPGASAQLAAANLQNWLKGVISRSGSTLVSAQTLESAEADKLEGIKVGVKFESDIGSLKAILYAIESDILSLIIDRASVRSVDTKHAGRLGEQKPVRLRVSLEVKGFRQKDGS